MNQLCVKSKTINVKLTVTPERQSAQPDLSITIRSGQGDCPPTGRHSKDDLDLRPEASRPRFDWTRGAQRASWRARSAETEGSPPLPRRHLPTDPVRHRQLVELLQTSMEKNNLKFNNLK